VTALSLTISRDGADLVITNNPTGTDFWVDTVVSPQFSIRATYAPASAYVAGNKLLAAVLDASVLPLVVYAQAASSSALATLQAELEAAVSQFSYTVTLTVDGVARSWQADPTWPNWGDVDSGMVAAKIARASFAIPVNPA